MTAAVAGARSRGPWRNPATGGTAHGHRRPAEWQPMARRVAADDLLCPGDGANGDVDPLNDVTRISSLIKSIHHDIIYDELQST